MFNGEITSIVTKYRNKTIHRWFIRTCVNGRLYALTRRETAAAYRSSDYRLRNFIMYRHFYHSVNDSRSTLDQWNSILLVIGSWVCTARSISLPNSDTLNGKKNHADSPFSPHTLTHIIDPRLNRFRLNKTRQFLRISQHRSSTRTSKYVSFHILEIWMNESHFFHTNSFKIRVDS